MQVVIARGDQSLFVDAPTAKSKKRQATRCFAYLLVFTSRQPVGSYSVLEHAFLYYLLGSRYNYEHVKEILTLTYSYAFQHR